MWLARLVNRVLRRQGSPILLVVVVAAFVLVELVERRTDVVAIAVKGDAKVRISLRFWARVVRVRLGSCRFVRGERLASCFLWSF